MPAPKLYIPTLDGWRAVAIGIVLLCHDQTHFWGPVSTRWFLWNGERGVELFFALSGFLICTRLLEEERRTGSLHLQNFYLRRIFRIQPAAFAYLAVLSLLMLFGCLDKALPSVGFAVLNVRNYLPLTFPLKDWYTAHFWSLSVEEHFYLFLPPMLLLVRKRRAALLLALACLSTAWAYWTSRHPALQFGWAPMHHTGVAVNGILFAAAYAVLLKQPKTLAIAQRVLQPAAVFVVTGVLWYGLTLRNSFLLEPTLAMLLPLAIISTTLHAEGITGKVLEWAPLRAAGRLSYSLYLWQMLFFTFTMPVPSPHSPLLAMLQHSSLRYPALLCASLASYYGVERPFVRLGHRLEHFTV